MEETRALTPEEQKLASGPIFKTLMSFAIPSIISLVVNALYNIVDQIFIGNIVGFLGNGATNVVYPVTIIAMSIALLLGNGGGALFSLRLGEKNYEEARKTIGTSVTVTLAFSILLSILMFIFLEPMCRLFGGTDELMPYALDYGHIVILGCPLIAIIMSLSTFIRSDGNPTRAMLAMLVGACLNMVLDPFFMLVFKMGVKGAAWATVISQFAGVVITIPYIRKFKTVKVTKKDFVPDLKILWKIVSLGFSSFVSQVAMLFLIGLLNRSYVHYGALSKYGSEIPLTSVGICSKLSQIVVAFAMGMNMGSQPIVGYNYGAGNIARVKKTFLMAAGITTIMMAIGTIAFECFPQQIINLFGSESELYNEFATKCLRIFMLPLILNGIVSSTTIFFQAIGKPVKATILSSLRQIVILIPAIVIIPLFLGLDGVVISAPCADCIAFVVAIIFMCTQWKKLGKEKQKF